MTKPANLAYLILDGNLVFIFLFFYGLYLLNDVRNRECVFLWKFKNNSYFRKCGSKIWNTLLAVILIMT